MQPVPVGCAWQAPDWRMRHMPVGCARQAPDFGACGTCLLGARDKRLIGACGHVGCMPHSSDPPQCSHGQPHCRRLRALSSALQVWAPWWYENTHRGTGFASAVQTDSALRLLPDRLKPLLSECQAIMRLLLRDALKPITPPYRSPGCGDGAAGGSGGGRSAGVDESCSDDIEERNRNSLVMIRDGVRGAAQV
eukprot:363502-Chlamydomonas_euryale.AAC.1